MEKVSKTLKIGVSIITALLVMIIAAFSIVFSSSNAKANNMNYATTYSLVDGWSVEGNDVTLPYQVSLDKGEKISFVRVADSKLYKNDFIYFQTMRQGVNVYVNDNVVYSVNQNPLLLQTIQSNSMVLVNLKNIEIGDEIRVEFVNLKDTASTFTVNSIICGSNSSMLHYLATNEIVTFISLLSLAILFIVFICFTFISIRKKKFEIRFIAFGMFLVNGFLWLICDSPLLNVFHPTMEFFAIISNFAFALIPIGVLIFVKQSFDSKHRYLAGIDIGVLVCLVNIVFKLIVFVTRFARIDEFELLDQIIVFGSILLCMTYNFIFVCKNKNKEPQSLFLLIDFSIVFLFGICAAITFYLFPGFGFHKICSIAVVTFIVGLIIIMLYKSISNYRVNVRLIKDSEKYKELSYLDELTGLGNTRKFHEELSLLEYNEEIATLIVIDINNVKRVNDTYGHGAGDVIISQCAECMEKAFGVVGGNNFRIGGDEFACILYNDSIDVKELIDRFNEIVKASNGDRMYKLSVAIGYASTNGNNINSGDDLKFHADLSMYEDKNNKKAREDDKENETWRKMIDSIVSIFEVKDPYSAQHSNRVSYIAKFIAEQMELTAVVTNDVFLAGKLHDIGKVGISDKILLKKTKLTDEEFNEIKKHPLIGQKIILSSGGLNKIGTIIRHHHEKYNGSGYPDGLIGQDIPFESRILTIADSIDAMTSDRCYRKALSYDECKKEIEDNIGILYDPYIAKVTLDNWDELVAIHKDLKSQLD